MSEKTKCAQHVIRLLSQMCAVLTVCLTCLGMSACGSAARASLPRKRNLQTVPHIYYLVPDRLAPNASSVLSAAVIEGLAHTYQKQTGTQVSVSVVPQQKYEATLNRELTRPAPPTIFQISDRRDEAKWADYVASLENSALAGHLTDRRLAVQNGRRMTAIPFSQHAYGIVYRKSIVQKYMARDDAVVQSVASITNFDVLKAFADGLQAHRTDLGIQGAFAPAGWGNTPVQTIAGQLTNYPLACEFGNAQIATVRQLNGTCLSGLQQLEDLLGTDSEVSAGQAAHMSLSTAVSDFAQGKTAMIPLDTVNEDQLESALQNEHVDNSDIGVLPLRVQGVGEVLGDGSHQAQAAQSMTGFAVGANQYWCINRQASKIDQRASQAFLTWIATSAQGQKALQELGLSLPFTSAKGIQQSDLLQGMFDQPVSTRVPWLSDQAPTDQWLRDVGSALTAYTRSGGANGGNWSSVESAYRDGWETEHQMLEEDEG
jgi:raffinose/stachyose/melibiose transport system substrate-binding protein